MKSNLAWQLVINLTAVVLLAVACNDNRSNSGNNDSPLTPIQSTQSNTSQNQTDEVLDSEMLEKANSKPASVETLTTTASVDAQQIYAANNCSMCHASDLSGTKLGPTLKDLAQHGWDSKTLEAFLRNPKDRSANKDRLTALEGDYSMSMPAFPGDEEELPALVTWLLTK